VLDPQARIKLRIVAWGLGLQFAFAVIVLKTPASEVLQTISNGVKAMFGYAEAGSTFVFGDLGTAKPPMGFVFAFQVLPIIIFHRFVFRHSVLPGHHAVGGQGMAIAMQKSWAIEAPSR